jgi:hypothetical protein
MRVDTFKCDVCGKMKGEGNHWFRLEMGDAGMKMCPWGVMKLTGSSVDLCSDQCVLTMVQKWLTTMAEKSGLRFPDLRTGPAADIPVVTVRAN